MGRATSATAASRAKLLIDKGPDGAPAKRKREALGEVIISNNNNNNGKGKTLSGKALNKDSKVKVDNSALKVKSTTATTVRHPLKHVAGLPTVANTARRNTKILVARESTIVPEIRHEELVDRNAMAVDSDHHLRLKTHIIPPTHVPRKGMTRIPVVLGEDDERAAKRPRTSSDVPEDVDTVDRQLIAADEDSPTEGDLEVETEVEADPDGDQWDDLDAEDHDDPIMVSEYVNHIFEYMRTIEVRLFAIG